ncbi:MAG: hypothetical protein U0945_02620, partial [Flavobacterium sp.]|nr:hypothetical protein [Flavobacterium sp.]
NPNDDKYNYKLYSFIRENDGFHNFNVEIIENVNCNTKKELHLIEKQHILAQQYKLNVCIPCRTPHEYYIDNFEQKKAYSNEYRTIHRETINNNAKRPYECNCGGRYTYSTMQRHIKTNKHKVFLDV